MKSIHAHEQSLLTNCKWFYSLLRRCLSVYELWWNLGDSQHAQDSTSNISKSCQVSRLPALLGGKNRFCFFACNKHKTIVIGFYIFSQNFQLTQNSGHGFASSSSSLCGSGRMFSDISMVIFFSMQSTFCHSSSFLAGPCPACSSTRPCVVSITTVFFGFNIFASNTDQTCNCCLLTVQRSDAILVGLFIVPTRVCVIKVACSCVIIGYARMQCIITGWTTYIF